MSVRDWLVVGIKLIGIVGIVSVAFSFVGILSMAWMMITNMSTIETLLGGAFIVLGVALFAGVAYFLLFRTELIVGLIVGDTPHAGDGVVRAKPSSATYTLCFSLLGIWLLAFEFPLHLVKAGQSWIAYIQAGVKASDYHAMVLDVAYSTSLIAVVELLLGVAFLSLAGSIGERVHRLYAVEDVVEETAGAE